MSRYLQGIYLENVAWGRLVPDKGFEKYSASFALLISRGGLSVRPESRRLTDGYWNTEIKQHEDAFDKLKFAVAGWAVEDDILNNTHEGYDESRDEIVVASGRIDVSLDQHSLQAQPSVDEPRGKNPGSSENILKNSVSKITKTKVKSRSAKVNAGKD